MSIRRIAALAAALLSALAIAATTTGGAADATRIGHPLTVHAAAVDNLHAQPDVRVLPVHPDTRI